MKGGKANACKNKKQLELCFKLIWVVLFLTSASFSVSTTYASADQIKDIHITLTVGRHLEVDESVAADGIDVFTQNGIVTMSGSVDNLLARERSTKIAAMVKGVRSIINRIKVNPPPRIDLQIRTDVEQALLDDPATDLFGMSVNVHNGIVTLSGKAGSWQEENICLWVAKGVTGVKGVVSEIDVLKTPKRPDDEIKREIESRLAYDVWIDDALIEVSVMRGRVELTGRVGSLAEKTRAFSKSWIRGVKAVNDKDLIIDWSRSDNMRRPIDWSMKSGEEIRRAIEDAFAYDPRISRFDIGIEVDHGIVTLMGNVDNLKAKRMAEEDALNTHGVWSVKNRIKIRMSPKTSQRKFPNDDVEIARNVRIALLRNPNLYQHEISVSVRNRIVQLSGVVHSGFEKAVADDVVSRVKGVAKVLNTINVHQKWERKEDWEIQEDIENELWWSPFVSHKDVDVRVNDGVAHLIGIVDTLRERRAATKNAYEGGAKHVRNYIKVRYGPKSLQP